MVVPPPKWAKGEGVMEMKEREMEDGKWLSGREIEDWEGNKVGIIKLEWGECV